MMDKLKIMIYFYYFFFNLDHDCPMILNGQLNKTCNLLEVLTKYELLQSI